MMRLLALAVALLFVPSAAAEFGPESEDGWPIGEDGTVVRPPVAGQAAPLNKIGSLTVYPYYPLLTAEVQRMAQEYPGLVKLTSAGKSTLNLDVWLLEIANFQDASKPDFVPLAEREVLYLDGGTHSNEYSGVYFVTEIAQFLLDEYATNATAKWIVDNRHTWIVPMVNPDGSNAFGRLNAKAVNVNRNFPGTWGAVDEDPVLNNPGPEPESEPETRIVTGLLDRLQPDYVNSIHCCGNLWLYPYGAQHLGIAPDSLMFERICDEVFADVREDCGPIWSTIYPASGTTADEGYLRIGASSWSYEMSGRGAIVGPWGEPVVNTDVRVQERESWAGVLHAFLNVENYGANPRIASVDGTATSLTVDVRNDGWGNLTAGTLRLGDASAPLPFLGPGAQGRVTLVGAFSPGVAPFVLAYTERTMQAPQEERTQALELVADGDRLVAAGARPLASPTDMEAPGWNALFLLAGLGLALAWRRR